MYICNPDHLITLEEIMKLKHGEVIMVPKDYRTQVIGDFDLGDPIELLP